MSAIPPNPAYSKLKPKARKFIDCYLTSAAWNATEAARQAGYKSPESLGPRLSKKYRSIIETQADLLQQSSLVSPKKVMEGLSEIALDKGNRASDRTKAYEILARIHGMLSEKMTVDIESSSLRRELGGLAQSLALGMVQASSQVVDAEQVSQAQGLLDAPTSSTLDPGKEDQGEGQP